MLEIIVQKLRAIRSELLPRRNETHVPEAYFTEILQRGDYVN